MTLSIIGQSLCSVSHFIYCYVECHYASVGMLNVIMLSVEMLNDIMVSVIMLSVVAPLMFA